MLGWLRKKVLLEQMNSGLISAFTKIKEDLYFQKKMLEELYEHHHGFRHTTSLNHQRIADWIKHFDASIRKLEQDTAVVEKRFNEDFEAMSTALLNLFKDAYAKNIKDTQTLKKEILKEVEVLLSQGKPKPTDNEVNVSNVKPIMSEPTSFDSLSNPEKWLVGVFFNAENPFSYSPVYQKAGKQIKNKNKNEKIKI